MHPRLIFILMVLIIAGLVLLQRSTAKKTKALMEKERKYYDLLSQFKQSPTDEIPEELKSAAIHYGKEKGLNDTEALRNLDNDLSIMSNPQ
ncbi:MAG: hypothetical protein ACPGJV_09570 [Bacteriovoracaceae bacterium]